MEFVVYFLYTIIINFCHYRSQRVYDHIKYNFMLLRCLTGGLCNKLVEVEVVSNFMECHLSHLRYLWIILLLTHWMIFYEFCNRPWIIELTHRMKLAVMPSFIRGSWVTGKIRKLKSLKSWSYLNLKVKDYDLDVRHSYLQITLFCS
jgi:hypothetical protein